MDERNIKSILDMARGAIKEVVDYEMAGVIANIMDPNTKATEKRKLQLTLEFAPDDNRQVVGVNVVTKKTLAPTNAVRTSLFITDSADGDGYTAVEMVPDIPGQTNLFGEEQDSPAILNIYRPDKEERKNA